MINENAEKFSKTLCFELFCTLIRPVAQLVEHVTLNHGVEGSIPSGPTNPGNEKSWVFLCVYPFVQFSKQELTQSCSEVHRVTQSYSSQRLTLIASLFLTLCSVPCAFTLPAPRFASRSFSVGWLPAPCHIYTSMPMV